ncbi:MAG: leucine-rich repeat domain-containing protein [Candidatus Methanomethylophilaceae archaeon]
MGRAFDDDYAFYVDGFGSSYQIKGYQTDTGTTFEANQLITAGAVNNLLDAFRNFNLYFSTNNNPISVPNKLLTISTVPTWQTTTVLNSGINFVASFISTNMIGSTSIPANTKYSTTYYAAKTTSQEANTLWELIEVGNGFTNILGQSAETPLVQTTPTIISTSISTKSNMTVSSTGYLGVRIYGIRYGNAASMNLYGGGNYGSSLVLPTLGGAPLSITEAPIDDIAYGRKNQSWTQVLEPDGSGVGLSGIVKETDPKYINTLTNEQDLAALRTYHYGSQDIIESQTNWFQTDNDGTITNFIYQTGRENVVIPWMIDGKEIIKIGDHAFLLKPIETITAPKTIKYIGETAFLLCTNLVSISFPAVEIITNQAFSNCRNLTNIILPNAYYFDNNVFSQCTNLQYANLPNATIFKNYVFYNCLKLHTVILPKIEEISEGALENCNNLTSIVFSSNAPVVSSLTSIFENTSSNLICTVNNSFATGWDDTFQGKRVVRLPVYADTAIIDNIFIGNTIQDTKLNIFTDGTNIYQTDVINHTNKISTDSSVTNISQHLIISAGTIYERPDLVPSPESWFTFDGTNTITGYVGPTVNSDNIVIPYQINGKPITKIGSYSFAHNYISHDVTGIIYMPNIITDIDDEAFPGYPNKVYLPSSLKRIGSGAFDESALAIFGDVILPEGLTNIGNYAFEYCTYVKNLTIGKNVKYIGNFQFGGFGYHAPVNIYWYGDKPEVGEQIFTTCPPNSVTNIIMNPQASGWDSTFEGMPVIRYPLYADKLYSISGDLYLQGSNYGSRIINSILNWDIAFEWGNHAQAGYSIHEDSTNAATAVLSTRTITIDEMTGSLSSNLIFNTGYESRISALENAPESGGTIASVYSPISNVATGTTVSVTVSSTQQIYSVVTDSRILLFTNNLSSVVFSGTSNISWDVWIDFRTWLSIGGEEAWAADSRPYVVPSVGWANNIRWADGDVPEISTTGRYHFAFSTVDGSRVNGRQIYPTAQKWQRLVFQYALAATYADGWAYAQWNNPEITNYAKLFDSLPASQYKILKFAFWRWANAAQSKYAVAYQNDGQITPTYSTNTVIWSEAFGYRALGYYPQWRSMWHRDPQMVGTHITGEEINLRGNFVLWYLGYAEAAAMNRIYFYENAERPMNELEREQYDAGVRLPAGR